MCKGQGKDVARLKTELEAEERMLEPMSTDDPERVNAEERVQKLVQDLKKAQKKKKDDSAAAGEYMVTLCDVIRAI
eukprot:55129-Eustigmatos_ZCMA.PRE.1